MSAIEVGDIELGHYEENEDGYPVWEEKPSLMGSVGCRHSIYNSTNKIVKYITFIYSMCNHFGDDICPRIEHLYTGPLNPGKKSGTSVKICFNSERIGVYWSKVVPLIRQMRVEYMDGEEEVILEEQIVSMNNENSAYAIKQKEIARKREARAIENKRKKEEDRLARGIVAFAGIVNPSNCIVKKVGDITFYIRKEETYFGYKLWLVGLESSQPIKHLEIPSEELTGVSISEGWEKLGVESVTLPRDLKRVNFMKGYISSYVFDPSEYDVDTLIIPREVEYIRFEKKFLAGVKKIVFEDIEGWGIGGKKLLKDPVRTCKVIKEHEFVEMQKTWLGKLLSKIGL